MQSITPALIYIHQKHQRKYLKMSMIVIIGRAIISNFDFLVYSCLGNDRTDNCTFPLE